MTAFSRRRFVKGLAAGGAMVGMGAWDLRGLAQEAPRHPQQVLRGTSFDLSIGETPINFTGATKVAQTINGSIPGPVLRWREGDSVTLRVANRLLDEDTSIHWHGVILPAEMDGVPGLSFHGIRPGETFTYRFDVKQAGTYWYHSHSGFQEQRGIYGPLIIEPRGDDPITSDREHVILLSDWTDERPERVFAKLKKQSDYYNFNKRTLGDLFKDIRKQGFAVDREEAAEELTCVAAAVPTTSGEPPRYALSISFLTHRLTPERLKHAGAQVITGAAEIARNLP